MTLIPHIDELGCCGHDFRREGSEGHGGDAAPIAPGAVAATSAAASEFFARALAERLSPADVFRITITSFLDAYTFDVRRLMKCCIHHVLPSGHVIPFCAYNVLYREGHVALPALQSIARAPKAAHQARRTAASVTVGAWPATTCQPRSA